MIEKKKMLKLAHALNAMAPGWMDALTLMGAVLAFLAERRPSGIVDIDLPMIASDGLKYSWRLHLGRIGINDEAKP